MNHILLEEWKNYVRDMIDDDKRSRYEQHLSTCDHCMDLYLEAIELVQDDLPTIEGPSLYTDEVMSRIPFAESASPVSKDRKKNWYEEKMFHYVLATAMTLLLMATGVFSELTKVTTQFEKNRDHSSFTENVVNKTTALIDEVEKIEEKEAE